MKSKYPPGGMPRQGGLALPGEKALALRWVPILNALRDLSGYQVVWKPISGANTGIPRALREHRGDFCRAVKAQPGGRRRCIEACLWETTERALTSPGGFLKTCHGGVREWVEPIRGATGVLGVLFIGPMRGATGPGPYPNLKKLFNALPGPGGLKIARLRKLIKPLADHLAMELEKGNLISQAPGVMHPALARALDLMNTPEGRQLGARDLANHSGLSSSRFVHLFKEKLGTTLTAYRAQARLGEAKILLTQTQWPMAAVAQKVGWERQSNFSAAFRKLTGESPLGFRKKRQRP